MTETSPFHESNYRERKGKSCPLIEVTVGTSQKAVTVLADTGCSTGLAMLNNQIGELDLGQKISDDPYEITAADGHKVEAEIYKADINLNGVIIKKVVILVLNPAKFKIDTEDKEPIAYLGRGFLDHFNVVFKGKEQKIAFFHP